MWRAGVPDGAGYVNYNCRYSLIESHYLIREHSIACFIFRLYYAPDFELENNI